MFVLLPGRDYPCLASEPAVALALCWRAGLVIDCGTALWRHRQELEHEAARMCELSELIGASSDLNAGQWGQLYAMAAAFAPDLIVDLGRGYGNSTCLFTEVAHRLGNTRVVSIGFRDDHAWAERTEPKLRNALPTRWFEPLTIIEQDVRRVDFSLVYGSATRILLFWDMLGYGVTRYILDHALPPLAARDHLILVKDVTDARYHWVENAHRAANLLSQSSEVRALGAFLERNEIRFATAEHALRVWREEHTAEAVELESACVQFPKPNPLQASDWIYFEVQRTLAARARPGLLGRIRQLVGTAR